MKILYILPEGTVKSGGNWVTANRICRGLEKEGFSVDIAEVKDIKKEDLENYDIVHAFHAFKSLLKIENLVKDMRDKVVVSFTGTDIKQLEELKENKDALVTLVNEIKVAVVFHQEDKEKLIRHGICPEKIKIIAQAPMPLSQDYEGLELRDANKNHENEVRFLFSAGIRKVKAPLEMIDMMTSLRKKAKNITLTLIGPVLEEDLGREVTKKVVGKAWINHLGELSHHQAQECIMNCDIVLNTSISEGMSNVLLEAQQIGRPILARDNAGNRSIVDHGKDGFLFDDEKDFVDYGLRLVEDVNLRKTMGQAALLSRQTYGWMDEVSHYKNIYQCKVK